MYLLGYALDVLESAKFHVKDVRMLKEILESIDEIEATEKNLCADCECCRTFYDSKNETPPETICTNIESEFDECPVWYGDDTCPCFMKLVPELDYPDYED